MEGAGLDEPTATPVAAGTSPKNVNWARLGIGLTPVALGLFGIGWRAVRETHASVSGTALVGALVAFGMFAFFAAVILISSARHPNPDRPPLSRRLRGWSAFFGLFVAFWLCAVMGAVVAHGTR